MQDVLQDGQAPQALRELKNAGGFTAMPAAVAAGERQGESRFVCEGATGVQQAWEGVQRACREGQEEGGVACLRGASAERGLHRG